MTGRIGLSYDALQEAKVGEPFHCGLPSSCGRTVLWIRPRGSADPDNFDFFHEEDDFAQISQVSQTAHLLLVKVDSKEKLKSILDEYACHAQFLIISGHGTEDSIQFDHDRYVKTEDVSKEFFDSVKRSPITHVVLDSCSTAKSRERSIACAIAKACEKRVLAPQKNIVRASKVPHPLFLIGKATFPFLLSGANEVEMTPEGECKDHEWLREMTEAECDALAAKPYLCQSIFVEDKGVITLWDEIFRAHPNPEREERVRDTGLLQRYNVSTTVKYFDTLDGEGKKEAAAEFARFFIYGGVPPSRLVEKGYIDVAKEIVDFVPDRSTVKMYGFRLLLEHGAIGQASAVLAHIPERSKPLYLDRLLSILTTEQLQVLVEFKRLREHRSVEAASAILDRFNRRLSCDLRTEVFSRIDTSKPLDLNEFFRVTAECMKSHESSGEIFGKVWELSGKDDKGEGMEFGPNHLFDPSGLLCAYALFSQKE